MSLETRLARLEEAAAPDRGVIVMWQHVDETNEQARERWKDEHPGQDLDAAGVRVIIMRWTEEGENGW